MSYKIVRFYADINIVKEDKEKGLTLKEAQDHCSQEDTSKIDDNGDVVWFDGYVEED